ncbi:MAG: class II fumarate hydratase [Candidatus Heimdallarchaeota archaeon]|nr:MAG: class II fumarate hydratase [Candidatus Heimdallarchaeota archaeon]
MNDKTRLEKDILGELEVPANVYWGINTQRAINNFKISGRRFSESFIKALAQIKKACLQTNLELGLMDQNIGKAILQSIDEIALENKLLDQFPIDIFQTGSGTQTNMNMNEVLANRANEILGYELGKKQPIHPNDHVNKGQSSNDIIPTTMHLVSIEKIHKQLLPAIRNIISVLKQKVDEFKDIIKVGRTHLQDAVPIPLSLEFLVYLKQLTSEEQNIMEIIDELTSIPLGGTVLGTGINTHEEFGEIAVQKLSEITKIDFRSNPIKAEGIASHKVFVKLSGILKSLSLSLIKLANDIRWMSSGPRAGLGELLIPQEEPGSSIMPGKINPTQSEMLIQVCLQVIGNETTITFAEGFGSTLDLNVTKPLIISTILESILLLSNGIKSFTENCLKELRADQKQIEKHLEENLMIVTNLVSIIGYDKAAEIAKKAYESGKTIKEIIQEEKIMIDDLDKILDPKNMV